MIILQDYTLLKLNLICGDWRRITVMHCSLRSSFHFRERRNRNCVNQLWKLSYETYGYASLSRLRQLRGSGPPVASPRRGHSETLILSHNRPRRIVNCIPLRARSRRSHWPRRQAESSPPQHSRRRVPSHRHWETPTR